MDYYYIVYSETNKIYTKTPFSKHEAQQFIDGMHSKTQFGKQNKLEMRKYPDNARLYLKNVWGIDVE